MTTARRRTALSWIALPFWAVQLVTGAKSFRDNPLIGSKRLNAWGLHTTRIRVTHWLAGARRQRLARRLSAEDRAQFAEKGYVLVHDFMPPAEFEAMRDALLERAYPAREMKQGDAITRRIAIDGAMLRELPALRTLLKGHRWRSLMRYVSSFDIEPLYYIQTILSHPGKTAPDPQLNLHADTFHPTMKAWFFLTDVAEEDGPLTYVEGSHQLTRERLAWEKQRALNAPENVDRLSARGSMRIEGDELPALGLPPAKRFAVPANTLVVVDTCGFHARGESSRPSVRVEIWAYSRRNPFIPWLGMDFLSLPGVAERRISAMWKFRDRFAEWIGQPWKDVGGKTPLQREPSKK